ncbi:unnamed protein product, partial [marine sediment metagenome]
LPYIFNITGIPNWRILLSLSSMLAFLGAVIIYFFIQEGPHLAFGAKFHLSTLKDIFDKKSVRLANYSYFGHMSEYITFGHGLRDMKHLVSIKSKDMKYFANWKNII